jgi:hypothetical protein
MKNLLNDISQGEKNRILEMHSNKKSNVTEETINEGVKVIVRYSTEFGSSASIIDVTEIPKFSKRFNIRSINPVEDSNDEKVIVRYSTEFGSSASIIDVTEIPKFSKRFNILGVTPVEDSYDEEDDNVKYDSGPK